MTGTALARRLPAATARARRHELLWVGVAAVTAAQAGLIHLLVVPEHLAVSRVIGVLFVLVGVAQLALAAALLRWRLPSWALLGAILAHLTLVSLYVASRTTDLPFLPVHTNGGHVAGHLPEPEGIGNGTPVFRGERIEQVGLPDLACLAAELVLVTVLVGMLPRHLRSRTTTVMAILAVLGVIGRTVGVLW